MTAAHLNRRDVLHMALAGTAALTLGSCAELQPTVPPTPAVSTEPTAMSTTPRPDVLLIYFSRAGENYWEGGRRDLEVGNTERLARMITERIGCDVYRVESSEPYSDDYDDTVARNVREQDTDARPGIVGEPPDTSAYDVVILASPIWNVRPPMIMSSLAESVRLGGRTVLPVTTHAMSGLGRSIDVYSELAPDAKIGEGLAVRGDAVDSAGTELDRWLSDVGLV